MAGLEDPAVIDLVTEGHDGEFILIISYDQPWTDSDTELTLLREKINNYAAFAIDEGLINAYPRSADRRKRVQIDCVAPPTPRVADLLAAATSALDAYGIRLSVNLLPA